MIESVTFLNFKALRNTTLPLGPFTLLVGPNGSGKSTALKALEMFSNRQPPFQYQTLLSAGLRNSGEPVVRVGLNWARPLREIHTHFECSARASSTTWPGPVNQHAPMGNGESLAAKLARLRVYAFNPELLASQARLVPDPDLTRTGDNLVAVLDHLRDRVPERFDTLNEELARMLPEFDRILFETPHDGMRSFLLRTVKGRHAIPAQELSHGTLLALVILTLAYLPEPPPLIGIEEPDRGIHPRLLRDVRDALYRLSYPDQFGESRPPVQVVATTQSPYFLDLFKEHPEEIVIAQKEGLEARFERLVDRPDIHEILADAPLGEVWYSGVLGGVPG